MHECDVCGGIAMHMFDASDVDFATMDDFEAGVGQEVALCLECYAEVNDVGWDAFTGGG